MLKLAFSTGLLRQNLQLFLAIDFLHNLSYKEEFEGNTERSTAAYILVREDASTGLTYKLPLEGGYARSLMTEKTIYATMPIRAGMI